MVRRRTLLAMIPAGAVGFAAVWAALTDSWGTFGVEHAFGATYADLRYLTASAECFRADPHWSISTETCDPFGRPNNYPSLWLVLYAALGIDGSHTEFVAWAYIALFVASLFLLSWLAVRGAGRPAFVSLVVALAAVAPPTWLALERGSNDLVVFVIVVVACTLHILGRWSASALMLGAVTALKFFPIGAALAFVRKGQSGYVPLLVFIGSAGAGLMWIADEFPVIGRLTPQPIYPAFGASLIPQAAWNRLVSAESSPVPRLAGAMLFLFTMTGYVALIRWKRFRAIAGVSFLRDEVKRLMAGYRRDPLGTALVIFGGGPLISAYLMGTNYDYRMIFAIPLVAGLSRQVTRVWTLPGALLCLLLLEMWVSYPAPFGLQRALDIVWLFLAPALGLLVLRLALTPAMGSEDSKRTRLEGEFEEVHVEDPERNVD